MLESTSIERFRAGALLLLVCVLSAHAGEPAPAKTPGDALTQEEIKKALQVTLSNGCKSAVATLGKEDGFYKDQAVKIALPDDLESAEKKAGRGLGKARTSDRLVYLMNRAAEMAVPGTTEILAEAVADLVLENARELLKGSPDAATQHLKNTCSDSLEKKILPLVKQAALDVGTAAEYRPMIKRAGPDAKPLFGRFDLNAYITRKVMAGLFAKIADEEKRIREDPAAQASEILKRVFGAVAKRE